MGGEDIPLTSSLLLLCICLTFDFFMAQLTLAGRDKIDPHEPFATIQVFSPIPDWVILLEERKPSKDVLPEWELPCGNGWRSCQVGRLVKWQAEGRNDGHHRHIFTQIYLWNHNLEEPYYCKCNPDKMQNVNPRQQWDLGRLWPRSFLNLYKDAFVFHTQS